MSDISHRTCPIGPMAPGIKDSSPRAGGWDKNYKACSSCKQCHGTCSLPPTSNLYITAGRGRIQQRLIWKDGISADSRPVTQSLPETYKELLILSTAYFSASPSRPSSRQEHGTARTERGPPLTWTATPAHGSEPSKQASIDSHSPQDEWGRKDDLLLPHIESTHHVSHLKMSGIKSPLTVHHKVIPKQGKFFKARSRSVLTLH